MPTYQYSCTECGHFFEAVQSFSDDSLTVCPECEGRLRKVYNAVGVVFKGSGFYRTDSRAQADGVKAGAKDGAKGETSSNGSGSTKAGEGLDRGLLVRRRPRRPRRPPPRPDPASPEPAASRPCGLPTHVAADPPTFGRHDLAAPSTRSPRPSAARPAPAATPGAPAPAPARCGGRRRRCPRRPAGRGSGAAPDRDRLDRTARPGRRDRLSPAVTWSPTRFDPDVVPAGAVRDPAAIIGRVLAAPMTRGEVLTRVSTLARGLLRGYPGTTAVPLRITDAATVDLLRVGDRISLVVADPDGRQDADAAGRRRARRRHPERRLTRASAPAPRVDSWSRRSRRHRPARSPPRPPPRYSSRCGVDRFGGSDTCHPNRLGSRRRR